MAVRFRGGVGILILDPAGLVLAFERTDLPDAFQLPQGGMDKGEEPIDALWRELREETGLTDGHVRVVAEVPEWMGYELPVELRSKKTGRGQVHKWFILRSMTTNLPISLGEASHAEFRSWRWMELGRLAEQVVVFRQPVYRRLAAIVGQLAGDPPA